MRRWMLLALLCMGVIVIGVLAWFFLREPPDFVGRWQEPQDAYEQRPALGRCPSQSLMIDRNHDVFDAKLSGVQIFNGDSSGGIYGCAMMVFQCRETGSQLDCIANEDGFGAGAHITLSVDQSTGHLVMKPESDLWRSEFVRIKSSKQKGRSS